MKNFTAVTPDIQKELQISQLQTTVSGADLDFTQVNPYGEFYKRPLFVDNCSTCKNNNMKNLDGYGYGAYGGGQYTAAGGSYSGGGNSSSGGGGFSWGGLSAGGILQQGGSILNSYFQKETAQSAAEVAAANAAAAAAAAANTQAENAGKKIENQGAIDKIKAYIVPISIVGGLVIVGIATYFIFKKKKIQ
jgi:hypothetical protein